MTNTYPEERAAAERSGRRAVKPRSRGYSLLELMFTLAVAGILLGVGVPSFFEIVRNNRAAANANELVTTLSIARSEAIRRGARVTVCASSDGATCGGTWGQGWLVIRDSATSDAGAPSIADAADVLRVWPAPAGNAGVALTPGGTTWVRFLPRGNAVSSAGTMPVVYAVAIPGCTGLQGRNIEVNAVGRASTTRYTCP